jgi:hypothetical protein
MLYNYISPWANLANLKSLEQWEEGQRKKVGCYSRVLDTAHNKSFLIEK